VTISNWSSVHELLDSTPRKPRLMPAAVFGRWGKVDDAFGGSDSGPQLRPESVPFLIARDVYGCITSNSDRAWTTWTKQFPRTITPMSIISCRCFPFV